MARRGLITWLSVGSVVVGLSTVVASFMGCYVDARTQTGKCQGEDDGNPCTDTTCPEEPTKIVHAPKPEGTECARGENAGKCDKEGTCKLDCESNPATCKCASVEQCPVSTDCVTWTCATGQCDRADAMDGTQVNTADPHDCRKTVCMSGVAELVEDPTDLPENVAGDCKKPACDGMDPSTTNDDTDAPGDMTSGDCQKPACNNGSVGSAADNFDEPTDTECIDRYCDNGAPSETTANVCTPCTDGVCDSMGQCANCLTKPDWTTCGSLASPVKMCNGQQCDAGVDVACKSGHCRDGVCCNEACTTECRACNISESVGTCTNVAKFGEDTYWVGVIQKECKLSNGFACNGSGACKLKGGGTCSGNDGTPCLSGTCESAVCTWQVGEPCVSPSDCGALTCVGGKCQ